MADLDDYFIDTERSALCALSFFAHKLDRAIRNAVKLLEIEESSPRYGDFVAHMRAMVEVFDLRRYAVALEAFRSSHA